MNNSVLRIFSFNQRVLVGSHRSVTSLLEKLGLSFPLKKFDKTLIKVTDVPALEDKRIHTGQKWESHDYRIARFTDRRKLHTADRKAIDLIDDIPPTPCDTRTVSCDGGGGPLGHPKVYINLDKPGNHICGYCGLRFFYAKGKGDQTPYNFDNPGV